LAVVDDSHRPDQAELDEEMTRHADGPHSADVEKPHHGGQLTERPAAEVMRTCRVKAKSVHGPRTEFDDVIHAVSD